MSQHQFITQRLGSRKTQLKWRWG